MLDGKFYTEYEVSDELVAWLKAVKRTEKEKTAPTIHGVATKKEYQEGFKGVKDATGSESVHGMDYTIWKALAQSDFCAEFLCIMMSLPYMYGFRCNRWASLVDCMIRKKAGVDQINTVRLLGMLSADQNTSLKLFFSKRMNEQMESNGLNKS